MTAKRNYGGMEACFLDGMAPLVNSFNGYVEWGSGAWQYDATTTVDFD